MGRTGVMYIAEFGGYAETVTRHRYWACFAIQCRIDYLPVYSTLSARFVILYLVMYTYLH